MRRFATGLALTALLALAACAESTSSGEARTKNAALETTTSAASIEEPTTSAPVETSLPTTTTITGQPAAPTVATTTLPATTTTTTPASTTTQPTTTTTTAVAKKKTPKTTLAPPSPPGCDLQVRYGAISSTCGKIYGVSFRWHDGKKPISSNKSIGNGHGWETVYLGAQGPPREAKSALVTITFLYGKTTREVLVPLSGDTKIIRAPF